MSEGKQLQRGPSLERLVGDWRLQEQIGYGSFAVVWKAQHVTTGQVAAVKEIATHKLNPKLQDSLRSEVDILKRANHENIVKLYEIRKVRHVRRV